MYLEHFGLLQDLPLLCCLLLELVPGRQHPVPLLGNGCAVRVTGLHQPPRRLAQLVGPLLLRRQRGREVVVTLHKGLNVLEAVTDVNGVEELGLGRGGGVDLVRLTVEQLQVSHLLQKTKYIFFK